MSDQRPKGPIAWFRRGPLSWGARLVALGGLLCVLAWGAGRWFSDDHLWSQYLFWIPTLFVTVAAWAALIVSAVLSKISLRMGGVVLRPFLALACLGLLGWLLVGEWKIHRYVTPSGARETDIRVVHWNLSVASRAGSAGEIVKQHDPDIALVVNIGLDNNRQKILESLGELATGSVNEDGLPTGDVHFMFRYDLAVATRFPIRRWGEAHLEKVESQLEEWRSGWDPGRVIYLELDTTGSEAMGGEPLIVWVVDFPSDPTMPRREIMENAGKAVREWRGPLMEPDSIGRWVQIDDAADDALEAEEAEDAREHPLANPGFPAPDLVIGDFNAPRGSRSIRSFLGDLDNAYEQSGRGGAGSWHRRYPFWQIDQAFTGRRVEATRYRVVDPGLGEHRLQIVDLRAE